MAHNEKFNQKRLENLQMSLIDLQQTEWFLSFQEDILILHNPRFNANWEPYKLKQLIVILCHDGHGYGAVNLRPVHLQRNSLLIALPGQIAQSNEISEDFKGTFIVITERLLSRLNIGDTFLLYKSLENTSLFDLDEDTAIAFRSYIEMSKQLMHIQSRLPSMEEAVSLMTRLFFLIVNSVILPASAGPDPEQRQSEVMLHFLRLIKLHYREHRDVGFYAEKMNLSAKYMTTLIKKASGKPAIQWIEDAVILDAKAQLSSTVNTIQQIAYDLNFHSQALFGRYFKRAVGMSPSDYRSSLRVYQMGKKAE